MPKFLMERDIPGAGKRPAEPGGFPANRISRVTGTIDPSTAE